MLPPVFVHSLKGNYILGLRNCLVKMEILCGVSLLVLSKQIPAFNPAGFACILLLMIIFSVEELDVSLCS